MPLSGFRRSHFTDKYSLTLSKIGIVLSFYYCKSQIGSKCVLHCNFVMTGHRYIVTLFQKRYCCLFEYTLSIVTP